MISEADALSPPDQLKQSTTERSFSPDKQQKSGD